MVKFERKDAAFRLGIIAELSEPLSEPLEEEEEEVIIANNKLQQQQDRPKFVVSRNNLPTRGLNRGKAQRNDADFQKALIDTPVTRAQDILTDDGWLNDFLDNSGNSYSKPAPPTRKMSQLGLRFSIIPRSIAREDSLFGNFTINSKKTVSKTKRAACSTDKCEYKSAKAEEQRQKNLELEQFLQQNEVEKQNKRIKNNKNKRSKRARRE